MANAYGPYNTLNMLGANFEATTTNPEFALGTPALGTDNSTWVYVQADVPVPSGNAPVMNASTFHLTAATGGAYTAAATFAANEYGWVRKTTTPL